MEKEKVALIKAFEKNNELIKKGLSIIFTEFFTVKNVSDSEKARREGNNLYLQKIHNAKLHRHIFNYYCKSVALAPIESEALALAYGNRSAFLLHIKKYKECIEDIDRAIDITKSDTLKVKLLCRKVECFKNINSSGYQTLLDEAKTHVDRIDDGDESKEKLMEMIKTMKDLTITKNKVIKKSNRKHETSLDLSETDNVLKKVEIKQDEKYGRYLVAAKDYKPGDVIFIEKFYAASVNPQLSYMSCHSCLKTALNGIPCDHCNWAMFCSEDCKKIAWKAFHDTECSLMFYTKMNDGGLDLSLSIRMLILGLKEAGSIKQLKDDVESIDSSTGFEIDGFSVRRSIKNICSLKSDGHPNPSVEKIANAIIMTLIGILKCYQLSDNLDVKSIEDFTKNDDIIFLGSLLIKLHGIKESNGFAFADFISKCQNLKGSDQCKTDSCCERGNCITLLGSLINHSCYANAGKKFTEDKKIVVYAMHPIKKNSQIYITYYTYFYETQRIQRSALFKSYNFECNCQPCKELWPPVLLQDPQLINNYMQNKFSNGIEQRIFNQSKDIILQLLFDVGNTLTFKKESIDKLSVSMTQAFKSLKQPSPLICLIMGSFDIIFSYMTMVQTNPFDTCDKF